MFDAIPERIRPFVKLAILIAVIVFGFKSGLFASFYELFSNIRM